MNPRDSFIECDGSIRLPRIINSTRAEQTADGSPTTSADTPARRYALSRCRLRASSTNSQRNVLFPLAEGPLLKSTATKRVRIHGYEDDGPRSLTGSRRTRTSPATRCHPKKRRKYERPLPTEKPTPVRTLFNGSQCGYPQQQHYEEHSYFFVEMYVLETRKFRGNPKSDGHCTSSWLTICVYLSPSNLSNR